MEKRGFFNTTVPEDLIKDFRILANELDERQNRLLVEPIQDLLEKYEKESEE
jgi:hypothetical protein